MIDIALLAASVWTVLQPYLPILATKAAEEIGGLVPEAAGKVWNEIHKKLNKEATAKDAWEDLLKSPDDEDMQATFLQQLKKALSEDESFAMELSKLLETVGNSYKASLTGNGAIAQGVGTRAVGQGGVMIGGNVTGNIVIGSHNNTES